MWTCRTWSRKTSHWVWDQSSWSSKMTGPSWPPALSMGGCFKGRRGGGGISVCVELCLHDCMHKCGKWRRKWSKQVSLMWATCSFRHPSCHLAPPVGKKSNSSLSEFTRFLTLNIFWTDTNILLSPQLKPQGRWLKAWLFTSDGSKETKFNDSVGIKEE